MNELENQILAALEQLETAAKTVRTANPKPDLQALFRRLEQLTEQLPQGSDPNLVHYLRRKSYQKARLLLEGRDAENARGRCE